MKIPALSFPVGRLSRHGARLLGGAGSLSELTGDRHNPNGRYQMKRSTDCTACANGKHNLCFSIHCPCVRCNPVTA